METVKTQLLGEPVEYEYQKKNVKNFNLRVLRDGRITLSAPAWSTRSDAERFLQKNADFIVKARTKVLSSTYSDFRDGGRVYFLGNPYVLHTERGARYKAWRTETDFYLTVPPSSTFEKGYDRFLKSEAADLFSWLVPEVLPRFYPYGVKKLPVIKVEKMRSRWGVCFSEQNLVKFNTELLKYPPFAIEYVVCHELAHFVYADHSENFYRVLGSVFPDYEEAKNVLKSVY